MTPIFTLRCPGCCSRISVTPAVVGRLAALERLHIADRASLDFAPQDPRLQLEAHAGNGFLHERVASPPHDPADPAVDEPATRAARELVVVPAGPFPEVASLHALANEAPGA